MKAPLPPPTKPTLRSLLGIEVSGVLVSGLIVPAQNLNLLTGRSGMQTKYPQAVFQGQILPLPPLFVIVILNLIVILIHFRSAFRISFELRTSDFGLRILFAFTASP